MKTYNVSARVFNTRVRTRTRTLHRSLVYRAAFYWGTKQGSEPLYNGTCSFTGPHSILHPNIYVQNHTQKAKFENNNV